MADITLEPGSPSERVAVHLRNNPGKVLTRMDVATLLTIVPGAVDTALRAGTALSLITCFNDGDEGRCWRAGPMLAHWKPATTGEAAAPSAAAPKAAPAPATTPAAKQRGGKRQLLPMLNIKDLKVEKGAPVPVSRISQKGRTRYDGVFDLCASDDTSVSMIDISYQHALIKALQTYLTHRPALKASTWVIRRVDDTTCGVWRLPKAKPAAAEPARKMARAA